MRDKDSSVLSLIYRRPAATCNHSFFRWLRRERPFLDQDSFCNGLVKLFEEFCYSFVGVREVFQASGSLAGIQLDSSTWHTLL